VIRRTWEVDIEVKDGQQHKDCYRQNEMQNHSGESVIPDLFKVKRHFLSLRITNILSLRI
jgi:hypothetical protein